LTCGCDQRVGRVIAYALTWAAGYGLMAELVRAGRLDRFLGLRSGDRPSHDSTSDRETATRTIHGFIGERISQRPAESERPEKKSLAVRSAILAVSLASVIGIAGTMMTEIDYSSVFFLQAIGMETSDSVVRYFMLSTISGFISSVAYIAHFDIAPALGLYDPRVDRQGQDEIRLTRLVTLVCVGLIYLGYSVLRTVGHDDISTLL
jgi:hypothetical protein